MANGRNKTEVLSISMPRDLTRDIKRFARENDITVSHVAKNAIRTYILQRQLRQVQKAFAPAFKKLGIKTDDDVEKYFG